MSSCSKCKGRAWLHVGDRVTFGANKTYFSHSHLILKSRLLGVIVNDLGKNTKFYVYNPGPKISKDLEKPKKFKVKIISPIKFEKYLNQVCNGNVIKKRNPSLKSVLKDGSAVYGIGLTKGEQIQLSKFAKKNKLRIFKVRKESISAVFCNHAFLNSGDSKIFRAWQIPVYDISKIKLDS